MSNTTITASLTIALFVSGCAQAPDKVEASYVSPSTFEGRTCSRLLEERNEIVSRLNTLAAEQQQAANTDAVATGVALVLFWPAAFALAATKDNASALASAKGNYDAITTQMTRQGCRLPASATPVQATKATEEEKKRSWE